MKTAGCISTAGKVPFRPKTDTPQPHPALNRGRVLPTRHTPEERETNVDDITRQYPDAPPCPFQIGDRVKMNRKYLATLTGATKTTESRKRHTVRGMSLVGPKSDTTGKNHSWEIHFDGSGGASASWLELA